MKTFLILVVLLSGVNTVRDLRPLTANTNCGIRPLSVIISSPLTKSQWLFSNGMNAEVREPAVAGSFYPAEKDKLDNMVLSFLENARKEDISGNLIGILSPHAGYVFSGSVAACSYKLLEGKELNTVILLGPSHRVSINYASVYDKGSFLTPLGEVKVNEKLVKELLNSSDILKASPHVQVEEHSIEVQIPFLQKVLKNFTIVPVMIGHLDFEAHEKLGKTIAKILKKKKNFIIVISSDLSHYPSYNDAKNVDLEILKEIKEIDPAGLLKKDKELMKKGILELYCTACGIEAVFTGLFCLKELGVNEGVILKYANSGDTPYYGDKNKVVGYGAVAFVKEAEFDLSNDAKNELLNIARSTMEEYLKTGKKKKYKPTLAVLNNKAAAFVTLRKKGRLRGCIGHLTARLPLYETVIDMALAAAFEDYRFSPVTDEELKDIKIEISVLSPVKEIKNPEEIQMGKHGVIVQKGGNSGVFLPQVATETGWSREKFLSELCYQKAGLPSDAWKDKDTILYVFTVVLFEEE